MGKQSNQIIDNLIQINAIKFNPANPFTWASGWRSPIYCDNRKILSYPNVRKAVCKGFCNVINEHFLGVDVIAGVATGAIAHGMLVAEELNLPFVYVRPEPKKHGLTNQVEGELPQGKRVLVIEDLVSTGKSSLNAVRALRDAGCEVLGMVAIFTYGFPQANENFRSEGVVLKTLGSYTELVEQGLKSGIIDRDQEDILQKWRLDPENWGK
jgi:orotate phosphoribosyltransferase